MRHHVYLFTESSSLISLSTAQLISCATFISDAKEAATNTRLFELFHSMRELHRLYRKKRTLDITAARV
jgi:hypothetical protein